MNTFPDHAFRAYDIRGIVDEELDASFAFDLGRALGQEVRDRGGIRASLAFDCRESSEGLMRSLAQGLVHEGIEVISQGMGPTPLLYFSMVEHSSALDPRPPSVHPENGVSAAYDLGVMITGSHNPSNYNGFKIVYAAGAAYGDEIQKLARSMRAIRATEGWAPVREEAPAPPETCVRDAYVDAILASVRPAKRRLRLSVDAANGAAGPLAARVLRAMGHEVIGHGLEPDGTFPLHHPDPTAPASLEYMRQAVLDDQSDACLGFDGDGDRLAVVDERGEAIMGDRLLACFAEEVLQNQSGATIIGEVKCSRVLFNHIEALGGLAVMGKVGHSVMKAQIREYNAALAGEVSGHFFFADRWFGFDDGIYAAARFAEWLGERDEPMSARMAHLPESFASPELRVACTEAEKFVRMRAIAETLGAMTDIIEVDGVRAEWPDGWGLVRASNTEPVFVLRAEAESINRRDEILALLHELVSLPIDDA